MGWLDGRKSSDEEENSNADEKIIADLKAQVERLTAQNNVLSGQNNAYAYTSQDQREKIAKLQERLAKYESDGDATSSVEEEDNAQEQRISELEAQLLEANKAKQESTSKLLASEKQLSKLRDICTRAVNMGNTYKSSFEKLTSEHKGTLEELAQLKKAGGGRSQGTVALEAELAGMKAQKDALVAKSAELEGKISSLEQQIDELQETVDGKDTDLASLNQKLAESQTLYTELQKDKDANDRELKTAKLTCDRLTRELDTNKGLLSSMTSERDKANNEVERLKKVVEAYKKQLKSVKELLSGGLPDIG